MDSMIRPKDQKNNSAKSAHHSAINHLAQPSIASKILVFLLIVAAILVIVTMAWGLLARTNKFVDEDKYQAVFLTNGQVYFGKLSGAGNEYVVLKDVYYLQQNENQEAQAGQQNQQQDASGNVTLVKLGNELHGPEDEMFIVRDKIIFWENLKDDGKVVQGIKDNQNN